MLSARFFTCQLTLEVFDTEEAREHKKLSNTLHIHITHKKFAQNPICMLQMISQP